MPGIGLDIAEVLNELGVTATILRPTGNLTEKIVYEVNALSANAFLRENLLNASFNYKTVITTGDIIRCHDTHYLVINKTADDFEDEIVEYAGVIYKCNMPDTTLILEPVITSDPVTFIVTHTWAIRKSGAIGLMTQDKRSTERDSGTSTGKDLTFVLECFVPRHYGTQIGDRVYISASVYYRVQDIERYRFPDVDVLYLVGDDRLAYTP